MKANKKNLLLLVLLGAGLVSSFGFGEEVRKAARKSNRVELTMSPAKKIDSEVGTLQDYYGERDRSKSYRNREIDENEKGQNTRHQWHRIDPYNEED